MTSDSQWGSDFQSISAYSGHYRPTDDSLDSFQSYLKEKGVNLDEVKVIDKDKDVFCVSFFVHAFFIDYFLYSWFQIGKANEDSDMYEDGKFNERTASEVSSTAEMPEPEMSEETQKKEEEPRLESVGSYKRTLSGGLQSPRAEVPKKAILQRINSKKAAKSYQLGHRLSLKWSTGAGPRIGCVADYPVQLRVQALEMLNLSPKFPPTPSSCRRIGLLSPPPRFSPHSTCSNGDGTCGNGTTRE